MTSTGLMTLRYGKIKRNVNGAQKESNITEEGNFQTNYIGSDESENTVIYVSHIVKSTKTFTCSVLIYLIIFLLILPWIYLFFTKLN